MENENEQNEQNEKNEQNTQNDHVENPENIDENQYNSNVSQNENKQQSRSQTRPDLDDLNTLLAHLIEEKNKLAEEGNYVQAEAVKVKISQLKKAIEDKNKYSLIYQQELEIKSLEDEYNRDSLQLQNDWDIKFSEFNQKNLKIEEEMNNQHNTEIKALYEFIEQSLSTILLPKHSRQFLDLKQVEMNMVKQERYMEAQMIKQKADVMEAEEAQRINKERDNKIKSKIDKMNKKQHLEMDVFKEKVKLEMEIMNKQRGDEVKSLNTKYRNRRNDLGTQQKQERNLHENSNLMRAKTMSKLNRDRRMNSMSKSKIAMDFNPESRIKQFKQFYKTQPNRENPVEHVKIDLSN